MTCCAIAELRPDGSRRRFQVDLGDDCGYFHGHFPDHPILPAVAQLDLVAESIRRAGSPRVEITRIEALRFRRPLRPGERFEIVVEPAESRDAAQFEIRQDETIVSSGSVAWVEHAG